MRIKTVPLRNNSKKQGNTGLVAGKVREIANTIPLIASTNNGGIFKSLGSSYEQGKENKEGILYEQSRTLRRYR